LAKSTVPLISAAMPVPEPPPLSEIITPGFSVWNTSAHAWPRFTIVSEPSTLMEPVSSSAADSVPVSAGSLVLPQPTSPKAKTAASASTIHFFNVTPLLCIR